MKKAKKIGIILTILVIIVLLIYIGIKTINKINKPNGEENITTKLYIETDYLNWFIDFDKLYNSKVKSPLYSVNKNDFEKINKLLSNEESNIYLENNVYYLNDYTTLELDIKTRSFRYIKYQGKKMIETLEVRLLNGKYYVQLLNENKLYKIVFNKNKVKKKKYKETSIKNSIFGNETFEW